jgi:hypothetical protein
MQSLHAYLNISLFRQSITAFSPDGKCIASRDSSVVHNRTGHSGHVYRTHPFGQFRGILARGAAHRKNWTGCSTPFQSNPIAFSPDDFRKLCKSYFTFSSLIQLFVLFKNTAKSNFCGNSTLLLSFCYFLSFLCRIPDWEKGQCFLVDQGPMRRDFWSSR